MNPFKHNRTLPEHLLSGEDKALDDLFNKIYNSAIDDTIEVFEKYHKMFDGIPDMIIQTIQSLKK